MATCIVSGTLLDPSATPVQGAPVSFTTQTPILEAEPVVTSTTSDVNGSWNLTLIQSLSGIVSVSVPQATTGQAMLYKFNVLVPASSTASFSSIVVDS